MIWIIWINIFCFATSFKQLLSVLITKLGLMEFIQEMFYVTNLEDKTSTGALDFIIYWQKCSYIFCFFWNWIYSSRRIKQSQRQIHNLKTIWWFHYVWILLSSFHRIYDCRKKFVRLYQFIFYEWLLK